MFVDYFEIIKPSNENPSICNCQTKKKLLWHHIFVLWTNMKWLKWNRKCDGNHGIFVCSTLRCTLKSVERFVHPIFIIDHIQRKKIQNKFLAIYVYYIGIVNWIRFDFKSYYFCVVFLHERIICPFLMICLQFSALSVRLKMLMIILWINHLQ